MSPHHWRETSGWVIVGQLVIVTRLIIPLSIIIVAHLPFVPVADPAPVADRHPGLVEALIDALEDLERKFTHGGPGGAQIPVSAFSARRYFISATGPWR